MNKALFYFFIIVYLTLYELNNPITDWENEGNPTNPKYLEKIIKNILIEQFANCE
jgi:hypothetical protein